jgi:hypothetical protein
LPYIGTMPKPIELPPEVARRFVRDVRAFFAPGYDAIKRDGSPRTRAPVGCCPD